MQTVVIGAGGGIGYGFLKYLQKRGDELIATYHSSAPADPLQGVSYVQLDVTDEQEVARFCDSLGDVGLFINAVGYLHGKGSFPEKSVHQIDRDYFLSSMTVNAMPTLLFSKYLVGHFRHSMPAVFNTVSARVGSIEENHLGGWYSYRASKAALNQLLRTLSIEWRRTVPNVCVAALHPGTTDTELSKPFQARVPAGQLFTPDQSVSYMMRVIEGLTPAVTGRFWSFDGEELPW